MTQYELVALGTLVLEDLGIGTGRKQGAVVILSNHIRQHRDQYPGAIIGKSKIKLPRDPELIELARRVSREEGMYQTRTLRDPNYISFTAHFQQYLSGIELVRARSEVIKGVEDGKLPTESVKPLESHLALSVDYLSQVENYLRTKENGFKLTPKRRYKVAKKKEGTNPKVKEPFNPKLGSWFNPELDNNPEKSEAIEEDTKIQRPKPTRSLKAPEARTISYDERRLIVASLEKQVEENEDNNLRFGPIHLIEKLNISRSSIGQHLDMLGEFKTTGRYSGYDPKKVLELAQLVLKEQASEVKS